MNLDSQSFRHSRAGKQAAAVRDGRATAADATTRSMPADRSNEPTRPMKLNEPDAAPITDALAQRTRILIKGLNEIRPQCAGDKWVTLEIPRSLLSDLQAVAKALGEKTP